MQSAVFHIQTDPLKLWYVAHGRVQSPCPPQLFIILERETGTGARTGPTGTGACTGPSKTGRGVSRILSRGRVGTALCHGGLAPFTAPCSGQADGQTERHDISGWQARTVSDGQVSTLDVAVDRQTVRRKGTTSLAGRLGRSQARPFFLESTARFQIQENFPPV